MSPKEAITREIGKNPEAKIAPPALLNPIDTLNSRIRTDQESFLLGYQCFKSFHEYLRSHQREFQRHYDLYREGIWFLQGCYGHILHFDSVSQDKV